MIEDISNVGVLGSSAQQPKILRTCGVCAKEYHDKDITLIDRQDEVSLLHIQCPHCKHSMLAWLGPTLVGMGLVGMITDLSRQDMIRARSRGSLSEDELLEFYNVIHNQSLAKFFINK